MLVVLYKEEILLKKDSLLSFHYPEQGRLTTLYSWQQCLVSLQKAGGGERRRELKAR